MILTYILSMTFTFSASFGWCIHQYKLIIILDDLQVIFWVVCHNNMLSLNTLALVSFIPCMSYQLWPTFEPYQTEWIVFFLEKSKLFIQEIIFPYPWIIAD